MQRVLLLLFALWAPMVQAQCRQALALALDVSGSVDSGEYRMQIDGLAGALDNADVRRALLSQPHAPVDLIVYEWSSPDYQRILLPWTAITNAATLDSVIARLHATQRGAAPPGTAIGSALLAGAALLQDHPGCWKQTLDVSGDGKHNMGPHPQTQKSRLQAGDVTVNGLVIGADNPRQGTASADDIASLSAYFRAYVITGPGAFVETALGFHDYEAAMVRKLLRELEGLSLAEAEAEAKPVRSGTGR